MLMNQKTRTAKDRVGDCGCMANGPSFPYLLLADVAAA